MTAVKKWVAAGSSAAVLAGGLFLGAPAAHADTCTAPTASAEISQLITAADNLHDAGVHFNSLVTDAETRAKLETAQANLEQAILVSDVKGPAEAAWNEIRMLQDSYAASSSDPAVADAHAAAVAAADEFRATALTSGVVMEEGQTLIDIFESECGPLLTSGVGGGTSDGTDGDWAGGDRGGDDSAPATGSNEGWNVDTAAEDSGSTGLIAGLLAAGGAAAAAVALRLRRRA